MQLDAECLFAPLQLRWLVNRVAGLAAVMHPAAAVGSDVEIGEGTVVMAGCVTNSGARVGRNVIVNTGATIDHDCEIADAVHIGPGRTCAVTLPSVWQR